MNKTSFYNQEKEPQGPDTTGLLECFWLNKNKTSDSFDFPILLINLDQLDTDFSIRKDQLIEIVMNAYEETKKKFESSPEYGNHVKNGTYKRKFIIMDPINEATIIIEIKIQRYLNKDEGHTHTFYGGIYMPYFPFLICQALLILGEKIESEHFEDQEHAKYDKVNVQEYCDSWNISVRRYYGLFRIVKDKILLMRNSKIKDVKEVLYYIYKSLI